MGETDKINRTSYLDVKGNTEKSNIANIEMPLTQIANSGGARILKFTYIFLYITYIFII